MTSNMKVSDAVLKKLEKLRDIADHQRDLARMKANLSQEILSDLGVDDALGAGTTTFEAEDGSLTVKVKVAQELEVDHDALAARMAALKKSKLLGTVVRLEFKIDKRGFDKLSPEDRALFEGAVSVVKKKPALEV